MRKAKDNPCVPVRYYRPLITTCPHCGAPLFRRCILWRKYVITLNGRWRIFSMGYSCSRATCTQANVIHRSPDAEQLSPKGSSFGFDLIAQVGWWRFLDHPTLDELVTLLEAKHGPVSRPTILTPISAFRALLRPAPPPQI